jgi:hypothetical protein
MRKREGVAFPDLMRMIINIYDRDLFMTRYFDIPDAENPVVRNDRVFLCPNPEGIRILK